LTRLRTTPAAWSNFISSTLKNIDHSSGILLGAGTGTWENSSYIKTILSMPGLDYLDYIDLHIYPLNQDGAWLDLALKWANDARAAGKKVTVRESWLYKALFEELGSGGMGNAELMMNRDFYSFWSPLDIRFVRDMIDLADAAKMDFFSFFWTRNFFAYLDYDKTPGNLSTLELNRLINQAGLKNMQKGILSPLGQYFQGKLTSRPVQ
jgi:hypothetical protein